MSVRVCNLSKGDGYVFITMSPVASERLSTESTRAFTFLNKLISSLSKYSLRAGRVEPNFNVPQGSYSLRLTARFCGQSP